MDGKDKKKPAVDEQFLMEMMAGGGTANAGKPAPETGKSAEPVPHVPAEKTRQKRQPAKDYLEIFFRNPETAARLGKSVYIRPEFHDRLARIVQVIGGDNMTIYAYLDNVLEFHFEEFGDQIVAAYNEKYKPIL